MRRLMLTSTAQALLAASTALQALLLLHGDDATAFGQFALSMLWLTLALGVQQALIGAPMLIRQQQHAQRLLLHLADWLALLLCLAALLLLLCWQLNWQLALMTALSQFCLLRRAVRRQLQHQQGAFRPAALQDSAFALVQISGSLLLWWAGACQLPVLLSLNLALLLLQEAIRLLQDSCARARQKQQPAAGRATRRGRVTGRRLWQSARACYQRQGQAALRGVFYVELLANGALYLLGWWAGPAAVAPFSAAALLWRPAAVLLAGVSQRWRPELRQRVLSGQSVAAAIREIRKVSFAVLLFNAMAALVLLCWVPTLIWPAGLSGSFLLICLLTALLGGLRAWRQADVMRLQAGDQFAVLAALQQMPALLAVLGAALWILLAGPWPSGLLLPGLLLPGLAAEIWLCRRLSHSFLPPEVR